MTESLRRVARRSVPGGLASLENLCLLRKAHNADTARRVFRDAFIAVSVSARETLTATIEDVARSRTSETARIADQL